jgi:hypothetical protein
MFRRRTREERPKSKIERRASSLPTSELIGWSESSVYAVSRNLSLWQRNQDPFYLEEAKIGAEALMAITTTLHERTKNER